MQLQTQVTRAQAGGKSGLSLYSQGVTPFLSADKFGGAFVTEIQPRYAALVENGFVYSTFYASGAVAAASATATGPFALFNPNNSGINLVILECMAQVVTFTAGTTGAGFGFQAVANQQPTTTTAGNAPTSTYVGGSNKSGANVFTAGTLVGAPTSPFYLIGGAYLDLAAGDAISIAKPIDGVVSVAPGSGICIVSSGTLVANLVASLTWAETPV